MIEANTELDSPRQNKEDSYSSKQASAMKAKTEGRSELPQIKNKYNSNSSQVKESLGDNRHIKYLFHEFCKQSYVGGVNATFDQIAGSAEKMTLNKWMVFCREFDLTQKLSARDMKLIFKKATDEQK